MGEGGASVATARVGMATVGAAVLGGSVAVGAVAAGDKTLQASAVSTANDAIVASLRMGPHFSTTNLTAPVRLGDY